MTRVCDGPGSWVLHILEKARCDRIGEEFSLPGQTETSGIGLQPTCFPHFLQLFHYLL